MSSSPLPPNLTARFSIVLVLLHLWNLWDRNVRLITWTLILFVTTQIANFACGIKVVVTLTREFVSTVVADG